MPDKTFNAECAQCDEVRTFEEFSRERRLVKSSEAMARGDFKFEWEFKFRCTTCGMREDKLVDVDDVLHKWQGSQHVVVDVSE
jgi:hypothetical protein